jgi:hypothetical protein
MLEQCLNVANILIIAYATNIFYCYNVFLSIIIILLTGNYLKIFKIEWFTIWQVGKLFLAV